VDEAQWTGSTGRVEESVETLYSVPHPLCSKRGQNAESLVCASGWRCKSCERVAARVHSLQVVSRYFSRARLLWVSQAESTQAGTQKIRDGSLTSRPIRMFRQYCPPVLEERIWGSWRNHRTNYHVRTTNLGSRLPSLTHQPRGADIS